MKFKSKALGDVALDLLLGEQEFTDMHVESGEPVMLRLGGNDWIQAQVDGEPIIFSRNDILTFLNGMFTGVARLPDLSRSDGESWPAWATELFKKGTLHHASQLNRPEARAAIEEGRSTEGLCCRVRFTIQSQTLRERIGIVMRPLRKVPPSLIDLGLPIQVRNLLLNSTSGLIVVTGPTGAGKTTTLATMVKELNASRPANILTLEDPIEFIHERDKGIINQREVGLDVTGFEAGVSDALRFVPDVIVIGEIRNANTMKAAVRAAESGHLVITSMHAPTTIGAVRKMLSYLSDNEASAQDVASALVFVVAQALVRASPQSGQRLLAYELLDSKGEASVSDAIAMASSDGGSRLASLERTLRAGQVPKAMSMFRRVQELVVKEKVDPRRAAAVLFDPHDRAEIMKLKDSFGRTG